MWIFSTRGFYSVVQDFKDPSYIQIRARKKEDLENLRREFHLKEKVIETPERDYRFRMVVPRTTWAYIGAHLVAEIDYPDFKKAAGKSGQEDKAFAMLEIWQTMVDYQEELVEDRPWLPWSWGNRGYGVKR